jgi:hypothetical protein
MGYPIPKSPAPGTKYKEGPQPLPLAARRNPYNLELVSWTGADTVLGKELLGDEDGSKGTKIQGYGSFEIWDNTVCQHLFFDKNGESVEGAVVFNTQDNTMTELRAKVFVVAAGERPYSQLTMCCNNCAVGGCSGGDRERGRGRERGEGLHVMASSFNLLGKKTIHNILD